MIVGVVEVVEHGGEGLQLQSARGRGGGGGWGAKTQGKEREVTINGKFPLYGTRSGNEEPCSRCDEECSMAT